MAPLTSDTGPPHGEVISRAVAVIPAGGSGRRMGAPTAKQYLPLGGIPVLVHTLRCFENCPAIDEVILVVPGDDVRRVTDDLVLPYGLTKVWKIVPGGPQRQDSVMNGLMAVDKGKDIVVVHDGVRPFIDPGFIERCISIARGHGAAVLGLPARDTVKDCDATGMVVRTLPRDRLWLAQTPQAFRRELLLRAYRQAFADGFYGTDDASLVERLGAKVMMVAGTAENIKITDLQDLAYAQWLLAKREARR